MSAPLNCCNSCATTETVNVPGIDGTDGAAGDNGINAYTYLTAQLTFDNTPDSLNEDVLVADSRWMAVGQVLIIGDAYPSVGESIWAHFRVAAINSATSVDLTYLDYYGDNGGGAVGGTGDHILANGCAVSPAGVSSSVNVAP